jgi:hypothetical protein
MQDRKILFNHIPKTAGTTLRIILNRTYKPGSVFFIESTDIKTSLKMYEDLDEESRNFFSVIAGHGSTFFQHKLENPYRITIVRSPVDLFISQYYYLKDSPHSVFKEEVSSLESLEAYMDYAIENGQDNLLTRYLSESIDWLIQPDLPIPNLNDEGDQLLEKAKSNLTAYDAVLSQAAFDKGVFGLKESLEWERIPFYRWYNKTKGKDIKAPKMLQLKLEYLLRFDLELYAYFLDEKIDIANRIKGNSSSFMFFKSRQALINSVSQVS